MNANKQSLYFIDHRNNPLLRKIKSISTLEPCSIQLHKLIFLLVSIKQITTPQYTLFCAISANILGYGYENHLDSTNGADGGLIIL